jgi:hypothetical protein
LRSEHSHALLDICESEVSILRVRFEVLVQT